VESARPSSFSTRWTTSEIKSSTDINVRQRFLKTPVTTSAASALSIGCVATTPAWSRRCSVEQFQLTGRGSCVGHDGSHASTYHGAGSKGSCAAFGAMYAKKGPLFILTV